MENMADSSADNSQAPANRRPRKMRNVGEEALNAAQAHAEKLSRLIMAPCVEADSGGWVTGREFGADHAFVPFKVSGRKSSVVAVAKFTNESSMLRKCVVSLLRILCASRAALFPDAERGAKGGKCGRATRSVTKLLQRYFDDPIPTSHVPVDSASLEEILRRAHEDEASVQEAPRTSLDVITSSRAEDVYAFQQESELSNGVGLINVVGYRTNPTNAEREKHFRNFSTIRCGSLARCGSACVDLTELGVRHGVLPSFYEDHGCGRLS